MINLLFLLLAVGAIRVEEHAKTLQVDPVICVENCTLSSDCKYGAWGGWALCSSSGVCDGAFTTSRSRIVTSPPLGSGAPCDAALIQTRNCTAAEAAVLTSSSYFTQQCAVPCLVGNWTLAQNCSRTVADCPSTRPSTGSITGIQIWSRPVIQSPQFGGALCPNLQQTVSCTVNCPYDCEWGPWTADAGQCSMNCAPPTNSTQNLQQYSRSPAVLAVNGGAACSGVSQMYQGPCGILAQLPACCPGCRDEGWTPWSQCVTSNSYHGQPCGSGTQRRTRTLLPPANMMTACPNSPDSCGDTSQTITCCDGVCPIDCVCGSWSAWSTCTNDGALQCGSGTSTRTRSCTPPQFGGLACGALSQTTTCAMAPCPTPCVMDTWGPWSSCGATCGPRQYQTRTRPMIAPPTFGGNPCGPSSQTQACLCIPCPVNCEVGPWELWGPCSQPCGNATQQRVRDVLVEPQYGGAGCPLLLDERECFINDQGWVAELNSAGDYVQGYANEPCSVNCEVSQWGPWSQCSQSCVPDDARTVPGTQTRVRNVTVAPVFKGSACPTTSDQRLCNSQCCPVDCQVAPWGAWSTCSSTCGGGSQRRERVISVFSRCGGAACEDTVFYEDQPCNTQCCSSPCEYYPYGEWSPCLTLGQNGTMENVTCGEVGTKFRERSVMHTNPCAPNTCNNTIQTQTCSIGTCLVNCQIGPWGTWSSCSANCGWGIQIRNRPLIQPQNGGTPCPCDHQYQPCNLKPCCPTCSLTEWGPWEGCSATCGTGAVQHRRRWVNGTDSFCNVTACEEMQLVDTNPCVLPTCPSPCSVSAWSSWSACSVSCGLGVTTQTRTILSPGDGNCPWLEQQNFCNLGACPQPCIYSEWAPWSPCPLTCQPPTGQVATQTRVRSPISLGTGNDCPTQVVQSQNCTLYPCITLCQVSQWSSWTQCVPASGWGQKSRTRTITVTPSPSQSCPDLLAIGFCYSKPPPTPCEWSTWFEWGDWSASCGPATRERQRILLSAPATIDTGNGSVTYDLATCSNYGAPTQIQSKQLGKCPVNCVVSTWSDWGDCIYPGYRTRDRTILTLPLYGGTPCPDCLHEVDQCTIKSNNAPPNTCEVQPCEEES